MPNAPDYVPTPWVHSSKGCIPGEVVKDDGEMVSIQLAVATTIEVIAQVFGGFIEAGTIIQVSKHLITKKTLE